MGKNNRERRAAKIKNRAKARAQHQGQHRHRNRPTGAGPRVGADESWTPPDAPIFSDEELARYLLLAAATGAVAPDPAFGGSQFERLHQLPARVVNREAEVALLVQVAALWAGGWQPSELHRQGRRGCSTAAAGRLVALAIAADDAGRRATSLDTRWRDQVAALKLPAANGRPGWITRWAEEEGFDRAQALRAIIDALRNVSTLPCLDPLLDMPGVDGGPPRPAPVASGTIGAEIDPVLERVRNLLAKAESTTFEAEATAFTAKAQELITRHAIDAALAHGQRVNGAADGPVMIRVPIDAPYVDAKSLLLQTVAEACRCRAVFHGGVDLSAVVGFPDDVAATETLFTSLLVQAQSAMAEAARHAPPGTRTRSQSYRSAFLLAYTERIGDRLREINEAVFAEVEASEGTAFLPALRSRSDDVDGLVAERFGDLASKRVRGGYDAVGWAHGLTAADRARLAFGDLEEEAVPR